MTRLCISKKLMVRSDIRHAVTIWEYDHKNLLLVKEYITDGEKLTKDYEKIVKDFEKLTKTIMM